MPIGRILGIPILLVPAVLLLLVFAFAPLLASGEDTGLALMLVVMLGVSLLAHELAHAVVARHLGLHVIDITIWPLGGMARLEGMAERPSAEAPVAVAGPLANIALAVLFYFLPWGWAEWGVWLNLLLGVGNLLPAFPLDGGRLLRAWLARANPMIDATFAAVRVGRWLTLIAMILLVGNGEWIIGLVLAVYLWWSGQAEYLQVMMRTGRPPTIPMGEVFRRAWRAGRHGSQTENPDDAGPPESATEEDLEGFHGTLDEYFDRRN